MEIKELESMSSAALFELSDKYQQAAIEKRLMELLEAKVPEMERVIEEAHTKYCLSQLSEEKAQKLELQEREDRLKSSLVSLQQQLVSLQQQLDACQKERQQLETKAEQQAQELKELRETAERDALQQGYRLACEEKIGALLPFIQTETYEAYVTSIYNRDNIARLYSMMRSDYDRGDDRKMDMYRRLVNEYIEISRRVTGKSSVQLQTVEANALFEPARFDKVPGAKEVGQVTKVIYYGLEKNGAVISGCKSLVEVE